MQNEVLESTFISDGDRENTRKCSIRLPLHIWEDAKPPRLRKLGCAALCDEDDEESDDQERERRRAKTQASSLRSEVGPRGDSISHALVKGASLGLGNKRNQGPSRICKDEHATGVCVTCSNRMHTDDPEIFWLCSTGMHGRQCYCQHLHEMLRGPR